MVKIDFNKTPDIKPTKTIPKLRYLYKTGKVTLDKYRGIVDFLFKAEKEQIEFFSKQEI